MEPPFKKKNSSANAATISEKVMFLKTAIDELIKEIQQDPSKEKMRETLHSFSTSEPTGIPYSRVPAWWTE